MLYLQAVEPELLAGLKFLSALPELENYRLVGGTALALKYGHRKSVDIDLFGQDLLDWDTLNQAVSAFETPQSVSKSKAIHSFILRGVKVDIVRYNYPWLAEVEEHDGMRLASTKDIAAMKLNAIAGRGVKKDFIDLNLLLDHFSLAEMLSFYREKYNQTSDFMVLKSLLYFDDADENDDPVILNDYNWQAVKNRIVSEIQKLTR